MAATASTTSISVGIPDIHHCTMFLNFHTVIVYDNGTSGFLGEHSCQDGTPTLRMNEFILGSLAANKVDLGPARTESTASGLPEPTELKFVVDANVAKAVEGSCQRFDELVGAHDLHVRSGHSNSGFTRLIALS